MPANIRVIVDDGLKEEATALFAALGMTLDEAIRLFLRRSVRERGLPFPMRRLSLPRRQCRLRRSPLSLDR